MFNHRRNSFRRNTSGGNSSFNRNSRPGTSFGGKTSFNKPSRANFSKGGQFGNPRKRNASQLARDPSIFIKKANPTFTQESFTPHQNFNDFAISEKLKSNIAAKGYTQPTPIQDQAIQPILDGKDLIGIANTGTGKTAAFLIPLINKVFRNQNSKILIVAPTRELASQINDEFKSFSAGSGLRSALIIGGSGLHRQRNDVLRRPNFVIATPGRLRDVVERRIINLSDFDSFVLDEVDLMVDIGFIHDIKYFISLLPVQRQSLFFSATMNPKVTEILNGFVNNPITVSVKQQDTSENVDQDVIKTISKEGKIDQLHDLLISDGFDKVLIFGRTKHGVEKLNRQLVDRGFKVSAIHGNKNQNQRLRALNSFKSNETNILLATDVASRGLDINNVTHVINYEVPESFDDYIHRIGRTGRAGQKGIALTFVD